MPPHISPNDEVPVVSKSSPQAQLAMVSNAEENPLVGCRRVVTLVGSRPGCKVVLQHKHIAPVHVAIVNTGKHVYAVDLVSHYGSQLNSLKLEHELLTDGDMLTIDPWDFRVDIQPGQEHCCDSDAVDLNLDPTPHLVALEHVDSGRILHSQREVCIIGRQIGCDISIDDDCVSRVHAILFKYGGQPVIADLLSHNQTLLNGEPVRFHILKNQDLLTFGDAEFRVRLVGSGVAERAANGDSPVVGHSVTTRARTRPDLIDLDETEEDTDWRHATRAGNRVRKEE